MQSRRSIFLPFLLVTLAAVSLAKEPPIETITWPPSGPPVVRFDFGKFRELNSQGGGRRELTTDTRAENLWGKPIARAEFSVYFFDKNKIRIGEGWIQISNLGAGQSVKFELNVTCIGNPTSLEVMPKYLPPELASYLPPTTVNITVNSVPQGAELKIDGKALGATPKLVRLSRGKHVLEFAKEGYSTGTFPLEISSDDVSGGSVSFELGSAAHDTLELRDGSVLSGDLESISATEAIVRVGGALQKIDRNQIKRILLIERQTAAQQ